MSLEEAVRSLQVDVAGLLDRVKAQEEATTDIKKGVLALEVATTGTRKTLENFVGRFNEVAEMLIAHDTEQLKRHAELEALVYQIRDRVETLEKRPPAA